MLQINKTGDTDLKATRRKTIEMYMSVFFSLWRILNIRKSNQNGIMNVLCKFTSTNNSLLLIFIHPNLLSSTIIILNFSTVISLHLYLSMILYKIGLFSFKNNYNMIIPKVFNNTYLISLNIQVVFNFLIIS